MPNRPSRKEGPARAALIAAGTILLLIVLGALLASCAKVEPIEPNESGDYPDLMNEYLKQSPTIATGTPASAASPAPATNQTEATTENGTAIVPIENSNLPQ